MLLITGATGTVGRPLVAALVAAGARVRAVSRDPAAAALPPGVEVVAPTPAAVKDVTAAFVNPAAMSTETLQEVRSQGVRRIVLLSALAVETHAGSLIARHHERLEAEVVTAAPEWVILRPGMFAANTIRQWAGQIRAGDVVRGPYASSTDAPIHEDDVARAAVAALLQDDLLGRRLRLTGPQSLTRAQMVTAIGDVLGRSLHYQEIPAGTARAAMIEQGLPAETADAALALWRATAGRPSTVAPEAADVLGRRPRTFAEWVGDHAADF
jgi:uncharacterized protein YbjT (DUF2867 family)